MQTAQGFAIQRSIEIDAGHRVPTHGSKCANLHGHRYKVVAEVVSQTLIGKPAEGRFLHLPNEPQDSADVQTDMVLDFGFLKDIMVEHIDLLCDHGMILWCNDPWTKVFLNREDPVILKSPTDYLVQEGVRGDPPKLLVVSFIPTAERLAEFWYGLMKEDVHVRSQRQAHLNRVIVHETPNCHAVYPSYPIV